MNKKILTAAIVFSVAAASAFAQIKTETETTKPSTITTAPSQTAPIKTNDLEPTDKVKQPLTPPDVVLEKFKTMYPAVKEVKWIMNKQQNYVGVFKNNVNECRAVCKADGSLVREVTVVQQSSRPVDVNAYLTKNFAGKTPKKCEQVKNDNGMLIYTIRFDDKLVRLDSRGNEVKQVEELDKAE